MDHKIKMSSIKIVHIVINDINHDYGKCNSDNFIIYLPDIVGELIHNAK